MSGFRVGHRVAALSAVNCIINSVFDLFAMMAGLCAGAVICDLCDTCACIGTGRASMSGQSAMALVSAH